MQPIAEVPAIESGAALRDIVTRYQPVVLRGQVGRWPAVAAGRRGPSAIAAYILGFAGEQSVSVMVGSASIAGNFFYGEDLRGVNFRRDTVSLRQLLDSLVALIDDPAAPCLYAGATPTADLLPGWETSNPLSLSIEGAVARVWIGNRTHVCTHYDVSSNLACVVAGRRRFVLFPPEQIANLYVGPLDFTLAGQPTSMVDVYKPDFDRFPRFATALEHAQVAELEPGDAIFIPSLWWHDITAVSALNVLVNYWWGQDDDCPAFPALVHALLSLRDVAPGERAAWRCWFDYYVFGDQAAASGDHLPAHARGVLGSPTRQRTQRIKDYLLRALSRR